MKPDQFGAPQCAVFGVFDGHGEDGDHCSIFAKQRVPVQMTKQMKKDPSNIDGCYTKAFVQSNIDMHKEPFDDIASGTTAITVLFDGKTMHVANVGDSRAVVAEMKGGLEERPPSIPVISCKFHMRPITGEQVLEHPSILAFVA